MILDVIAAIISLGFGIFTLWKPQVVATASSFSLVGARGFTELRVAFGGYFIGMGIAILLLNDPMASRAIGFGWLGAAVVRGVELAMGKREEIADQTFFVIWVVEIATGLMLVL